MRKLSDDTICDFNISKAKNNETGEFVYIKEYMKSFINSSDENKAAFKKEIELMKMLKGDAFVKILDICETKSSYLVVIEYFEGKTLENYLISNKTLSESFVQKIIRKLSPAFKYLEENGLILEFISPKSFCFNYFNNEDNFSIKFFDYGLNKIYSDTNYQRCYTLNQSDDSHKKNVLSFGIIIYQLIFGETIYQFNSKDEPNKTLNSSTLLYYIKTRKINKTNQEHFQAIKEFIRKNMPFK